MVRIRKADERGRTRIGWLNARHTFSFGDYFDPGQMGFRSLRVLNDDVVGPGAGFPSHPHRDMEILTWVLDGSLGHRDSLGSGAVVHPGEVQRMSAGTGIVHSEYNPSTTAPVHLLQIWIHPDRQGLPPEYEQKAIPIAAQPGRLLLVASPDGREGSVRIHQDTLVWAARLGPGDELGYTIGRGRGAWLQVARGEVSLNGLSLQEGDGAAIEDEGRLRIVAVSPSEILLFDLA